MSLPFSKEECRRIVSASLATGLVVDRKSRNAYDAVCEELEQAKTKLRAAEAMIDCLSKTSTGTDRRAVRRVLAIQASLEAGEHVQARDFSKALKVSNKTIYRDIAFIREKMGIDIKFVRTRHYGGGHWEMSS